MEGYSCGTSKRAPKKAEVKRRVWSTKEEDCLVHELKDLVATGFKCENGFRSGYLGVIEKALNVSFPGTDLKATPHIHSKIIVWKKQYNSLCGIIGMSGLGWNEADKTIDVEIEEKWEEYTKIDTNARNMRYKSWPYFHLWGYIFGKDRATGADGADHFAANDSLNFQDTYSNPYPENQTPNGTAPEESEQNSVSNKESTGNADTRKSRRNKRSFEDAQSSLVGAFNTFSSETKDIMQQFVTRVGHNVDLNNKRDGVHAALKKISWLTVHDRITVAHHLVKSSEDLVLFFSMEDADREEEMVQMIMNGLLDGK